MENEIVENHKQYLERKALYKSFGYDVDEERFFILENAKPISGNILEAGTGKGHFALCLAQAGYSFVTFDISAQEQHFAKLNIVHFGFEKQVDFRIENAERTSFSSGSFDIVFCVNVLHHLQNAYQVINELTRVLKTQGKLILADFTQEGFEVMDKMHSLEGAKHEVSSVSLVDAQVYLTQRGFLISSARSVYQRVLIAKKS